MTFVVSEGSLRSLDKPTLPRAMTLRLTDDFTQDYAEIWRTQPAVRTVVSFLARNVASLGIHAFRRVSDTDRVRLADHPAAVLLGKPNPRTTRYRLINALVHDLGIYDKAYWLKLSGPALLRMPPANVTPRGDNWMWPDRFELRGSKGKQEFGWEKVVHFHGYNPDDPADGCSPIEALRRVLAEEYEAGRMREQTLRNGARVSGYLERPKDAPRWSEPAKQKFRADWQSQYAGDGPQAGGTPILEDGMTFNRASQTAEDLQYIQARKLTREEVAAAYFIPPPMVGILDHASFSNITEQHKMLYQDTLGPWLDMITQELGLQLLPDLPDATNVYLEFNLAEKLRGSFEEQAAQLQSAVGAPYLTRNEARARQNLPSVPGGDDLVVPLNVLIGGQASPQDSTPKAGHWDLLPDGHPQKAKQCPTCRVIYVDEKFARDCRCNRPALGKGRAPSTHETKFEQVLVAFFERQERSVRSALGAKAAGDWWDGERWDSELSSDLYRLAIQTSQEVAGETLKAIGFEPDEYDVDRTLAFLAAVSGRIAGAMNAVTKGQLEDALDGLEDDEDPKDALSHVFDLAKGARAVQAAATAVTTFSGFGTTEAARQVAGDQATKTWVTGANPRPEHAAMSGETVGIDEAFSNGAQWPADSGDVDQDAGCNCSVEISVG